MSYLSGVTGTKQSVLSLNRSATGEISPLGHSVAGLSFGDRRMEGRLTVKVLKKRWEKTLQATLIAAAGNPRIYRQVKTQASEIIESPVDIKEYFPTVEKLLCRLETLDPDGRGSIFDIFNTRLSPSSIWQVKLLRMECKDLLVHLDAFDEWRRKKHRLKVVK